MNIFVLKNGERLGPFTVQGLAAEYHKGTITLSDLAWEPGFAEWKEIKMVPAYLDAIVPPTTGQRAPTEQPPPLPIAKDDQTAELSTSKKRRGWGSVIFHACIIFALSFIGGFAAAILSTGHGEIYGADIQNICNLLSITLGFFIVGYVVKQNRFPHLIKVWFVVWMLSLVNLCFGLDCPTWLLGGVILVVMMLIGWGLSSLFVREIR